MCARNPVRYRVHRLLGRRVETWAAAVHPAGEPGAIRSRWLSPDDEARISAIPFRDEQMRFAAGRVLARRVLSRKLGLAPHRVSILLSGADGRPYLAGWPGYDFNLSHSGNQVVLVVAYGLRVGIDVERLEWRNAGIDLARRLFAEREYESLVHADQRHYLRRWYRIWTTREAYTKACGVGVFGTRSALPDRGAGWARSGVRVPDQYVCSVVAVSPTEMDRTMPSQKTRRNHR
jgi:phosphopantetheinyl transferase